MPRAKPVQTNPAWRVTFQWVDKNDQPVGEPFEIRVGAHSDAEAINTANEYLAYLAKPGKNKLDEKVKNDYRPAPPHKGAVRKVVVRVESWAHGGWFPSNMSRVRKATLYRTELDTLVTFSAGGYESTVQPLREGGG